MKYIFVYRTYNYTAFLLYALQEYEYTIEQNGNVKYQVGSDEFILTRNLTNIDNILPSDKKILLCTDDWRRFDCDGYDMIICNFPAESVGTNVTDDDLKIFLDNGNICLSGATVAFEHPNFITDYSLNLKYLYYFQGHHFVNYYDYKNTKTNLLGLYYNKNHISGRIIETRVEIYEKVKSILGDDLHIYPILENKLTPVLNPYYGMGLWERNNSSSYIDFITSACTLIFETCQTTDESIHREHMSEKTLKGIMYSEVNVFTIWYGSRKQYNYLKNKGFWFLNFEFYDENLESGSKIRDSIYRTTEYLKNLKQNLGSDDLVHKHLLEVYGYKLKENVRLFKNLLNNCDLKDTIISKIKG